MFLVGDVLVSLDILEKDFCCDLSVCRGSCCIEGDAGAPISDAEVQQVENILPLLLPDMTQEAKSVIEQQGISYLDCSGERVMSIVNDKDCIFARTNHNGWSYCLLEKAYLEHRIEFRKPISCYLYPIRITTFSNPPIGGAKYGLEYHRWDICHCARVLGKQKKIPLYKFLREPLVARFGQNWYNELCLVAEEWKKQI